MKLQQIISKFIKLLVNDYKNYLDFVDEEGEQDADFRKTKENVSQGEYR